MQSPPASTHTARQAMRANRRVDTGPELALRSELHRRGLRFRKDLRIKAGDRWVRPDVVFTRARVAVFVDGCFWHSCPSHGEMPARNRNYWEPKLARNVERDLKSTAALQDAGWQVVRLWEHEELESAVESVLAALR